VISVNHIYLSDKVQHGSKGVFACIQPSQEKRFEG
jgi:hypothetical protein